LWYITFTARDSNTSLCVYFMCYWHCPHSMQIRVYVTVICPSIRLSVSHLRVKKQDSKLLSVTSPKILTDFRNSFTVRLRRKSVTKSYVVINTSRLTIPWTWGSLHYTTSNGVRTCAEHRHGICGRCVPAVDRYLLHAPALSSSAAVVARGCLPPGANVLLPPQIGHWYSYGYNDVTGADCHRTVRWVGGVIT